MTTIGEMLGFRTILVVVCAVAICDARVTHAVPPSDNPTDHWAFQAPVRPAPPTLKTPARREWVLNPIDAFIAAEQEVRGLTPTPAAPKHILLRRVYLDLIGLPPTPEELRAFIEDESPSAYEKVVDQLLQSPRYGERWGRHWMDVWRYSDWYGYKAELRNSQKHIWHWRDWIIESLNADAGYDRMVLLMIAADEAAPDDLGALRATGYLARNYYKFNRNVWLDDTIEHTAKAFLGLTMNCARCHEHKYDPIEQVDYYRFRAFFEPHQVRTDAVPGESDMSKDGLPRVYDADLNAATYRYLHGDDKQPDKEHPLAPGLPAFLNASSLHLEQVKLPATAFYPAMRPFAQQAAVAAAKANVDAKSSELTKRQAALEEAKKFASGDLNDTERKNAQHRLAMAEREVQASAQHHDATASQLEAVEARIAADNARYADPPATDAAALAINANLALRIAALRLAEANVTQGELDIARAEEALAAKPDDGKLKKGVEDAHKRQDELAKKLAAAKAEMEKPESVDYPTFGEVYPATSTGRRLALARWIVDRGNPLTARVAVNHIWLRHFGEPLVPTVFDFGVKGKPPTHPTLLDWLAVELMEGSSSAGGWSMKHLHRLIVTSNTYRMSSSTSGLHPAALARNRTIDPDNHYRWRANLRRMEAEVVRDSVLHVAGQLDLKMGGPELDEDSGLTTYRRSVYYRHAHEKYMTFLKTFDSANIIECYRRDETLVPQQGLAMANSRLLIEQARRLAGELSNAVVGGADSDRDQRFVAAAFRRVLAREATTEEMSESLAFLEAQAALLVNQKSLTPFGNGADVGVKPSADPRQRSREDFIHVLFNHNDFVAIR